MNNNTIIIIDDDPENLLMMQDMGLMMGYDIFTTDSPLEGLAWAQDIQPSLVILDMALGGEYDGIALTHMLKGDAHTAHIPILAITADLFRYNKQDVLAAGCDQYLSKPFRPSQFRDIVRQLTLQASA